MDDNVAWAGGTHTCTDTQLKTSCPWLARMNSHFYFRLGEIQHVSAGREPFLDLSLFTPTLFHYSCVYALQFRMARKAAAEQVLIPETDITNSDVRVWVVTTARCVLVFRESFVFYYNVIFVQLHNQREIPYTGRRPCRAAIAVQYVCGLCLQCIMWGLHRF